MQWSIKNRLKTSMEVDGNVIKIYNLFTVLKIGGILSLKFIVMGFLESARIKIAFAHLSKHSIYFYFLILNLSLLFERYFIGNLGRKIVYFLWLPKEIIFNQRNLLFILKTIEIFFFIFIFFILI